MEIEKTLAMHFYHYFPDAIVSIREKGDSKRRCVLSIEKDEETDMFLLVLLYETDYHVAFQRALMKYFTAQECFYKESGMIKRQYLSGERKEYIKMSIRVSKKEAYSLFVLLQKYLLVYICKEKEKK